MEFIPGDQYRLDIIGADSTIIVDSWTGQVRADIVGHNGELIVDVAANKVYGPFVGNVETLAGETVVDVENKQFNGVLYGDVYNSENELMLDADTNTLYANVNGNIVDEFDDVIVDVANRSVIADSFSGDFFGNFYGTLSSDSVIYGSFDGDFNGNAYGTFNGQHNGNFDGEFTGIHVGRVIGDVTGSIIGNLLYDENTPMTAFDTDNNKSTWLGSIHHADGSVILKNAADRNEVSITANIDKPTGERIVNIADDGGVTFTGILQGDIVDRNYKTVITTDGAQIKLGGELPLEIGNTDYLMSIYSKHTQYYTPKTNFIADFRHIAVGIDENGDFTDIVPEGKTFSIESLARYNGTDKRVGIIRFKIDESKPVDPESIFLPGEIHIRAFGGKMADDYGARLTITSDGVVRSRIFQADPIDFVKRDALAAQEGMIIFNTNTKKFQGFTGSNWVDLH